MTEDSNSEPLEKKHFFLSFYPIVVFLILLVLWLGYFYTLDSINYLQIALISIFSLLLLGSSFLFYQQQQKTQCP